jgi:flagellar protein FlbT
LTIPKARKASRFWSRRSWARADTSPLNVSFTKADSPSAISTDTGIESMALKVELKPRERMIIGDCVVTNDDQRTRLLIEGHAPILREKDIMTPQLATSPAKRIYLAIQLMYTSRDPSVHHDVYFALVRDITNAEPSVCPLVESINNLIVTGDMYKALKQAKKLVTYEDELANHAKPRTRLHLDGQADR